VARVFIGVPTLNRPRLVQETIESVRRQTFGDLRVVVSDNGSSAEARDTIERYIADLGDPRFSFHRQPMNCGEYGQGWFFFDQAQGHDFLIILHDDDLLEPDYVAEAVRVLDRETACDVFAADPSIIDIHGVVSPELTADFLRDHGRTNAAEGVYDIRTTHMMWGFTTISGTMFRPSALRASGFVDDDCHGNFPFEFNLFLRLGDVGAKGWHSKRQLMHVRFHEGSFRSGFSLGDNPHVVRTMLKLLARRHYDGPVERRRKVIVSRLRRAEALIRLREGDLGRCRSGLGDALRESFGPKAVSTAALAWVCPSLLRSSLPPLVQELTPPPAPRSFA
jgi:glycosyltransferase involved in cell wall biosynthesis